MCLVALPAAAAVQPPPFDEVVPRNPLELLIAHQETLGLTADQLDRLAHIRARLEAANDPLVDRMMALRRQWQEERLAAQRVGRRPDARRLERIRTATAPVHARIQQNNRTAMQAVNRLLLPPQRARLRALVDARQRAATAEGDAGEGGRGGRR